MPLPFIIAAGVALATAGYGVKKKLMQATLLMKLI